MLRKYLVLFKRARRPNVEHLCELLSARGESLPAGSIVLAGAATAAHMLQPGDQVRLTVEGLGSVSISVTQ